jgi:predicted permease
VFWPADLVNDFRHGGRLARRSPWFALSAILVLATGIGATIAVYTVLRDVLFRPLPYPDPDRIVHLFSMSPAGVNRFSSAPQFLNWEAETSVFEALTAIRDPSPALTMTNGGHTEAVRTLRVSAEYFAVFRAPLVYGRGFSRAEDVRNGPRVVVLSDGFSRRVFGGGNVVGRSLWLAEEPYEIVGVLSRSFVFDSSADVLLPLRADGAAADHTRNLRVIGRARTGVSLQGARADVVRTTPLFRREHPFVLGHDEYFSADTLHAVLVGPIRGVLQLVSGAVMLVLLVTCANVAMLLLSRGQLRTPEIAARLALGAGRGRIVRQLLVETELLALTGGVLAIPLAYVVLRTVLVTATADLPMPLRAMADSLALDMRVMIEAVIAALSTGAVCAVMPAVVAARTEVTTLFKSGATSAFSGWKGSGAQSALLLTEVAAALVLLAATAVVLDSVGRLRTTNLGFDPRNVLTLEVPLAGTPYRASAGLDLFINNATARLAGVGGLAGAAATFSLPNEQGNKTSFVIDDRALMGAGAHHGSVRWEIVSPEYFDTLRIRRVNGRLFDDRDRRGAPAVAMVNRTMALRFWGRQTPLRQRITLGARDWPEADDTREIVGVIADVRRADSSEAEPTVYIPMWQAGDHVLARQQTLSPLRWVVRANTDPRVLASTIATALERAGPGLSVVQAESMQDVLASQLARARFALQLLGGFTAVSVLLATVGLYGFIANAVAHRRKELGIRTALGASSGRLVHMIVWHGGRVVLGGIVLGLIGATLVGVGLERFIFGTRPLPAGQLAGLALLQLFVAAGAAFVAALPVTRIDPRRVID